MHSIVLQPMDLTSLRAVTSEFKARVLPSRFEKAYQSKPHTLQIGLRSLSGMTWIEFCWDNIAPRLVQTKQPSKMNGSSTLAKIIEHSLKNLTLVNLKQEGFERIIEFNFAKRPNEKTEF